MDREYTIAGFTGVLLNHGDLERFLSKYPLTWEEQRRAVGAAIKDVMQGPAAADREVAVALVRDLAKLYGFSKDDLRDMAFEVLRGAFDDDEEAQIVCHVVKYFLRDLIPEGPSFGYTGLCDSFTPAQKVATSESDSIDLICDLCFVELGYPTSMPFLEKEVLDLFDEVFVCCGDLSAREQIENFQVELKQEVHVETAERELEPRPRLTIKPSTSC